MAAASNSYYFSTAAATSAVTATATRGKSSFSLLHHHPNNHNHSTIMLLRTLGTSSRHARHRFVVTGQRIRSFPPQCHEALQRMSISSVALTAEERTTALQTRLAQPGNPNPWISDPNRNAITKRFLFANFSQAWAFLSQSALLAEKMDHHPEWFNVYNVVDVTLTTHDCQGVSHKDIEMAQAMDEYSAIIMGQKQQNRPPPPN